MRKSARLDRLTGISRLEHFLFTTRNDCPPKFVTGTQTLKKKPALLTLPATVNPPAWLSEPARLAWHELQSASGLTLEPGDLPGFSLLSELYAAFRNDPIGFGPSNTAQLRILMGEYALTPSGRAKRPVQTADNPFASIRRKI